MISHSNDRGFTLIEILMAVVLLGILTVVSIDLVSDTLNEGKYQDTVNRMQAISNAMMGDPSMKENGVRTSFGYLGDVGKIPQDLDAAGINDLITKPGGGFASWLINASVGFGLGWNGPYLHGGDSGTTTNYTDDAWGNSIHYDYTVSPPTLTSYGADGALGGSGLNSDIVITLPATSTKATVTGYVTNHYSPYTGAVDVELNYPDGTGNLTQALYTVTPPSGFFTFANVPFGTRSITAYIGSKGAPTKTLGPIVITVDKPNYTTSPGILDTNP